MIGCAGVLVLVFVAYGLLSLVGEDIYKKEGTRVFLELMILSVNFAIWLCEISEMGGISVLFEGGLGQVIHPNLLLASSMVIVPCLLIDSTPKWFGNWFGLSIIEAIVVLFMGVSYFGTGKFLGSILVAALGVSIGSTIVAIVEICRDGKRREKDLNDACREAFKKAFEKALRDAQNKEN